MRMRKHKFGVVLMVFLLTLAMGGSALAAPGSVTYRKYYDLDGIILMKIQAGSAYSESGHHKTLVRGVGSLQRDEMVTMSMAGIDVFNDSSWAADPGSLRGLEVASAFYLNDLWKEQGDNGGEEAPAPDAHQVFAVSVKAGTGESGRLSQNISAAAAVYSDESGSFAIDQFAATSGGTVKRFIDLIEPVSGLYLFEDSKIKGSAEIYDSLQPSGDEENMEIDALSISEEGKAEISGQSVVILEDDELFRITVNKGTLLEEIGLPETLDLEYGFTTITDIMVEWDKQDLEDYDPESEGSYLFFGKLIFPESVSIFEELYVCYIVEVIDTGTVNE